jgi:hypothetical protein
MDEAHENFRSVIATDPQNHDAHTYYDNFKWGWGGQ